MRAGRWVFLFLGGLLLVWLVRPSSVRAHAVLVRSDPPAGSVLAIPPTSIRLWFSEPIQTVGRGITVIAPTGQRVERGPVYVAGTQLQANVAATVSGTYVVIWQVISSDTHPERGRFTFSVRRAGISAAAAGTSEDTGAISPLGLELQIIGRWLHFTGFALGFGPIAFRLLVLQPLGLRRPGQAEQSLSRLVTTGIVALLLAEPLALLAQTTSLGSGELFDPILAGDVLASNFGRVLAQRLGAAVLLWVLVGAARQGTNATAPMALLLGLALALVDGEASHALTPGPVVLGLSANALHVAAMGLWVGGLASLILVWKLPELSERREEIVAGFGRLAAVSLAILALSGTVMAWMHLGRPAHLLTTSYGRILSAKLIGVFAVLLLARLGIRSHQNDQERWWILEASALTGILVLAGLLVSLPPPI